MRVECPSCGSSLKLTEEEAKQPSVKCWMCDSSVSTASARSKRGVSTVPVPGRKARAMPAAIGLRDSGIQVSRSDVVTQTLKVRVADGPSRSKEFELTRALTTIGRMGGGADMEIEDGQVSRSHCAIEIRSDGILLHDLRSTNGTYVEGERISVVRLEPGASFVIGSSRLTLDAI
jgi:Inner membrane component of T3SS, cytoplasmic domain